MMIFKDEHAFSLLPKIFFLTAMSVAGLFAGYLMFTDEANIFASLRPYAVSGNFARQIIISFFCWIYILRLFFTVFVFLKRKWAWGEVLVVSSLMSVALFALTRYGGGNDQPIGVLDYFAIFLYLSGSWLNTRSEYTRYIWKKAEINEGKPYTSGLFKYSMHINYFGDVLLFTGFALMTWRFSLLIIPLVMLLNFVFFIIPRLDKYLADKYGTEFKEYASKTKKLIPWIY